MLIPYQGLDFLMSWQEGAGRSAPEMPGLPGIYAQVFWPRRAARIGQTGNMRNRLREATSWAEGMHRGTARPSQLRRTSDLSMQVKASGNAGFEYFVVCADTSLSDELEHRGGADLVAGEV